MSQLKVFSWTNPNPAVARNIDTGFDVSEITIVDKTNGGSFYWNSGMANASILDVDSGTLTGTNGVTPLAQGAIYGAQITGFTNANPGVITATSIAQCGIVAGDVITVGGLADDLTATTLNQQYTVASVTATAITTGTDTSSYSVYVSGGVAVRKTDTAGTAIATQNYSIQGVILGTSAVGANSALMCAVCKSDMPVV